MYSLGDFVFKIRGEIVFLSVFGYWKRSLENFINIFFRFDLIAALL